MSRSRWLVLLGPPLVIALAASAAAVVAHPIRPLSGSAASRPAVTPCPPPVERRAGVGDPDPAWPGPGPAGAGRSTGTWWRSEPLLDAGGRLTAWNLTAATPAGRDVTLNLPPESSASGPVDGRVTIAEDDGARSSIVVLDVATRCTRTFDVGGPVSRRAILDPADGGVLVHLVARSTRADLGVWHLAVDGTRTLVLAPVATSILRAAGIGAVWATNLAVTRDGRRLAVQSCDPEACVTRVLARDTGRTTTLRGEHGDLVGFADPAGGQLVSMAACPGLPCGVLGWDAGGTPRLLVDAAIGAAVTGDGRVVAAIPGSGAAAEVITVDPASNARRAIGPLDRGTVPLPAGAALGGIEAGPAAVGIVGPSGQPALLEVTP